MVEIVLFYQLWVFLGVLAKAQLKVEGETLNDRKAAKHEKGKFKILKILLIVLVGFYETVHIGLFCCIVETVSPFLPTLKVQGAPPPKKNEKVCEQV